MSTSDGNVSSTKMLGPELSGPNAQIERAASKSQSYLVWKNSPSFFLSSNGKEIDENENGPGFHFGKRDSAKVFKAIVLNDFAIFKDEWCFRCSIHSMTSIQLYSLVPSNQNFLILNVFG